MEALINNNQDDGWTICPNCNGEGQYATYSCKICPDCNGKGYLSEIDGNKESCNLCGGRGKYELSQQIICRKCKGKGKIRKEQ